jgi:hypothetical protein
LAPRFARQGPLDEFPHVIARMRCSDISTPTHARCLALGVPIAGSVETSQGSWVTLRRRAAVQDPGEPDAINPVDLVALRVGRGLRPGQGSRRSRCCRFRDLRCGPPPRCLRFAATVPGDPARLASDVRGLLSSSAGLSPGVTTRSFRCYLLSSSTRLPGAPPTPLTGPRPPHARSFQEKFFLLGRREGEALLPPCRLRITISAARRHGSANRHSSVPEIPLEEIRNGSTRSSVGAVGGGRRAVSCASIPTRNPRRAGHGPPHRPQAGHAISRARFRVPIKIQQTTAAICAHATRSNQ